MFTLQEKKSITNLFKHRDVNAVAYLVKMTSLGRKDKVSEEDYQACTLIMEQFDNLKVYPEEDHPTNDDEYVTAAFNAYTELVFQYLATPEKKVSLLERFFHFSFKPKQQ